MTTRGELSPTEARTFRAGAIEIVLCEVEGEIYALDAICTHEDLPLEGAEVEDGVLECPWHGARYEVCSGRVKALPATRPLRVYPVRVTEGGEVFVDIPD